MALDQAELVKAVAAEVLKQLPQQQGTTRNTARSAVEPDDSMCGSGSEEEPTASWSTVLGSRYVQPSSDNGKRLAQMLATAPELQQLKTKATTVQLYSGVPETPPPRRNKVDTQLYNAQKKVETTMHLLVNFMESGDLTQIGTAAAFLRSTHQDLQEQRRSYLAGRQSWKLDPRADDAKPKLLSAEEEKKIRAPQERRPGPRTTQPFVPPPTGWGKGESKWFPSSSPRSRSRSQGRGKGGRGKGSK